MPRVACLQLEALDLARAAEALARALARIDEAAAQRPDLIVLPECTYPAYFLGAPGVARPDYATLQAAGAAFAERAARYRCHLVVGLALPESDALDAPWQNLAILWGPDGGEIGRSAKRFLWHFDGGWFDPGHSFPVFDTAMGRIGLMICADGRLPEIARCLALAGAELIVDPTAWVTWGRDRAALSNPQVDYMLATRAWENGLPIVAANKVGVEAGSVVYCGRSGVVGNAGEWMAQASSEREEVIVVDLPPLRHAHYPAPRIPERYADLVRPTAELPITQLIREPIVPDKATLRAALLQLGPDWEETVENRVRVLARQGVRLAVLSHGAILAESENLGALIPFDEGRVDRLRHLAAETGVVLAANLQYRLRLDRDNIEGIRDTALLVDGTGIQVRYDGHAAYGLGLTQAPVFDLDGFRVGLLHPADGYGPELARSLLLRGADVLIWWVPSDLDIATTVARSRADENKQYILLATPADKRRTGCSAIVGPAGQIVAQAFPGSDMAISATVALAQTRQKEMAPNTHVIYGRQPEAYRVLVMTSQPMEAIGD